MLVQDITLTLTVRVPAGSGTEGQVERAINAALDEGERRINDWGVWTVGAARITGVTMDEVPGDIEFD